LRCIIVLLAWLASTALGFGAETTSPKDFTATIQSVMANLRTAASYARTGNIALAQMETDEAMAAWTMLQDSAAAAPPPYQPAALQDFLASGRAKLAAAIGALGGGDTVGAGGDLFALRQSFHELRRKSGLYDLGDCIFEIAPAMEKLRTAATSFGEQPAPSHAEDTVIAAGAFRDRLQRCNAWASAEVSGQGEFRRLIDGAISSAGEIAHAAMAGDGPLVHRYLIELQSYAQLLDFRFG
jgi:hypothetical protein